MDHGDGAAPQAAHRGVETGAPEFSGKHRNLFRRRFFHEATGFIEESEGHSDIEITTYSEGEAPPETASLWATGGDAFASVDTAKFGFLGGSFSGDANDQFVAKVSFSANGTLADGEIASLSSTQKITWKADPGTTLPTSTNDYLTDPRHWKISAWETLASTLTRAPKSLFQDVTTTAIPLPTDRALIESPRHEELLKQLFKTGEIPLKPGTGRWFTTDATAQHPALSVVDIDADGWDDLYVCVRHGRNLLFRNQGDGTFLEEAEKYGLAIPGFTSAALFADFDNDGDQDAFLARTLERSLYLENRDGTFVAQDTIFPYLGTSLAAADYNSDGLLDIYLSTYGFAARNPRQDVADTFLSDYPEETVRSRFIAPPDAELFVNVPGPPNVLLVNTGGSFEVSPLSEQVAAWRETLQSTWADYDADGDPDLYVCNDFAPDLLYRNDGGTGFTLLEGHPRMQGFGMGASFGDFDNDLDLDLYVSNMYSKAGLRVTAKAGTLDERFRWFAEGNLLFENSAAEFDLLSAKGGSAYTVAKANWSWGGQFLDIDGDTHLDLYVPNGYYTAPGGFEAEEDL